MSKINVNTRNSKLVNGRLFITGLKMAQLSLALAEYIVRNSTITYPGYGVMYEYNGPYSRS